MKPGSTIYFKGDDPILVGDIKPEDWFEIRAVHTAPDFGFHRPPPMPQALHEWRVSFVDGDFNCQSVTVTAFSKRHAKKVTRKSYRVKQWLGVYR